MLFLGSSLDVPPTGSKRSPLPLRRWSSGLCGSKTNVISSARPSWANVHSSPANAMSSSKRSSRSGESFFRSAHSQNRPKVFHRNDVVGIQRRGRQGFRQGRKAVSTLRSSAPTSASAAVRNLRSEHGKGAKTPRTANRERSRTGGCAGSGWLCQGNGDNGIGKESTAGEKLRWVALNRSGRSAGLRPGAFPGLLYEHAGSELGAPVPGRGSEVGGSLFEVGCSDSPDHHSPAMHRPGMPLPGGERALVELRLVSAWGSTLILIVLLFLNFAELFPWDQEQEQEQEWERSA